MTSRFKTRAAAALAGSLAFHLGWLLVVDQVGTMPDPGVSFEWPAEVEFGIAEGATLTTPPSAPPEASSETHSKEPGEGSPAAGDEASDAGPRDASVLDAGRDGGSIDAGADDASVDGGVDADAGHLIAKAGEGKSSDAGAADADAGSSLASAEGAATKYQMPPGALIALRLDMKRVRASAQAAEIRNLVTRIPDWQALLGDSGIDPLDDLDRLLITSPDFRSRDRIVIAGTHSGGPDRIREVVGQMAKARGLEARFRPRHGVLVAPWPDADETDRVVAMVGKKHFVIAATELLPRFLAVAIARADREDTNGDDAPRSFEDELLAMREGEALAVDVEGARQYLRVAARAGLSEQHIPVRIRLGLSESDDGRVEVEAVGVYPKAADAEAASELAKSLLRRYGRNAWLALMGFASVLQNAEVEAADDHVIVRASLNRRQAALALELIAARILPRSVRNTSGRSRALPAPSKREARPSSAPTP